MDVLGPSFRAKPRRGLLAISYVLWVGLICFATAYTTVMLTRGTHGISVLWVSNAVMLAALIVRPSAWLPLLLSGAVGVGAANLLSGDSLGIACGLLGANCAEVLISFALLRRLDVDRFEFGSLPFLARFLPVAGLIGPCVSATLGAFVASTAFGGSYASVWLAWFTGCSLGMIIVAPMLIAFLRPHPAQFQQLKDARRGAALVTIAALCLVTIVVFSTSSTPVPLVPFAAVVIATVLFGQKMASAGLVFISSAGLASLWSGTGPLMNYVDTDERVLMLQGFLAVLALTCLPISAVLQERQSLSDRLVVAEARHRLLSEGSGDAILHISRDGTVLHASRAVTDLTGLTPEDLVGHPGTAFVHPEDRAAVARTHLEVVASGGAATVRYRYTHQRDGDERWLEIRTRAILTGAEVSGAISTVRDVTLLAAQERKMVYEAATDPLTGLANRRHFMTKLEETLSGSEPRQVAVAMLDIDRFKRFNDRHGHAAGDAVLCAVARAADAALRTGDLIARLGGEEFALLLLDTGREDALMIVERVRSAIAAQIVIFGGEALRVTVSIGAAATESGVSDPKSLLAAADASLYLAKNSGRDCVKFAA